ncbi:hypothetical protein FB567DRAFT_594678 [Paraphoma chrysanthemicola]|uniref:Uncharacterized protein n=1 Tax=Paraphoma chrysanthemicola TaxID=798071 RepID=A0A8K0QZW2_9PLEO|nr:hypothetical protein FB567DRAFT_594678 [Paraphoma chrysanthemicola]
MSYPPNNPELALRSPQHGIMTMHPFSFSLCSVPYAPTPPNSPSTSTYSSCGSSTTSTAPTTPTGSPTTKVVPKDAITVHCAQQGCAKMVDIVPFGEHGHGQMYVKVKCDECQVPMIIVETLKREKEKEENVWEEEIDEEYLDGEWEEGW